MAARRQRKKQASRRGLSVPELEMLEMLEEMLERFRWMQSLVHAQSYILREQLQLSDEELDGVLAGATRAIEKDASWQRWEAGLRRLRHELKRSHHAIESELEQEASERVSEASSDDAVEGAAEGGAGAG